MKKLYVSFLALLYLSTMSPMARGDRAGGGGNVLKSNRADLEEAVKGLRERLWEISDDYLYGGPFQITKGALKDDVLKVTVAVLGTPYFSVSKSFYEYAENLKYNIVDGPCYEDSEEKDASTFYYKNAPVCLSASRLARFPKSALKVALMPIIFHEIAHQFKFGEDDANRLQNLADVHLMYRPAYLAAWRAKMGCAGAEVNQTSPQALLYCGAQATTAEEIISRIYDGNQFGPLAAPSLTENDKRTIVTYCHYDYDHDGGLNVSEVLRALREPAVTGFNGHTANPLHIMTLAAKAAVDSIDQEVARLQDKIK